MRKLLISLVILVASQGARAQTLDMDFSWAIQAQAASWNQAQHDAASAARMWLDEVTAYRQATGYTGYIPGPVSQAQLQQSIQGMQQSFYDYNQSYYNTPSIPSVYAPTPYMNPDTGQSYYLPNDYNSYYVNPAGYVQGTHNYTAPDSYYQWTPLVPYP